MMLRRGSARRPGSALVLGAAAVLAAGSAVILLHLPRAFAPPRSLAALIPRAAAESRPIEPRLSGVAWAPFRPGQSSPSAGVTQAAVVTLRGEPAPEPRDPENLLRLVVKNPSAAIAHLSTKAAAGDASVWNDLAAAQYEGARRYADPELLAIGLGSVDRALALDPVLPEAAFNRALLLERLGLRDDAREAWSRFLALDSSSGWADDARAHLADLPPQPPFLQILDAQYDRVAASPSAAAALADRDPFGARGMAIFEVLGRWGAAVLRGNEADAARHLAVARQLGVPVAKRGDHMLERAVAAIDAAAGPARLLLATAHDRYHRGLAAFQHQRPVEAEPLLRQSAEEFARAGSPMAWVARYFAGNAAYDLGREQEVEREDELLLATIPSDFPAYRAFAFWELGICSSSRADWGSAIARHRQAIAIFERLEEPQNVAGVQQLLAVVYDRIGDPVTAWQLRAAALRTLGRSSAAPLQKVLLFVASSAILRRDWRTASSFLTLSIRLGERIGSDVHVANTLLFRAVVRDRLGDAAGARDDLDLARRMAPNLRDPAYRAYLEFAEWRATAMFASTPPALAEALVTRAIDFQLTRNDSLDVPGLLVQRARIRRRIGDRAGALADVERGIAGLEQHRESLPEGEARWGAFHSAEELFDEGVDLAIDGDDAAAALRFAERGRARALLESYGRSPIVDLSRLARGTVVVECVALPQRLVLLTADAGGVRASTVEVSREALAREIDDFTSALRRGAPRSGADALYRRLIEPVEAQLLGAASIVFVPDATTSTVAFSALQDSSGRALIERAPIVIAPSAAAFEAANERHSTSGRAPRSLLLLTAQSAAAGAGALQSVEVEARRVAAGYRDVDTIGDVASPFGELEARACRADVIHFGGHAVGDDHGYQPASILLRERGAERRVGASELAKLRLRPSAIVVLAGCSTARGERRAAEGVISVAHGFLSAGAPSVIATLWPIDDAAASRFFPRLHQRLAAGVAPAEALRETQLESIREGNVPAALWAAVQDIGS